MSTIELREHLLSLGAERAAASLHGLDAVESYMDDLTAEIEAARHAFTGAAVTEIATLRGQLHGVLSG
jgi:hypothetical protein